MANKRYTILAVDDERENLNLLARILEDRHRVLLADDGKSALDLLRRHDVQLVLADQRMPGMSGLQLLELVQACSPATVRVLLSGQSDLSGILETTKLAAIQRLVRKPWDSEELRSGLRELLKRGE